MHNFIPHHKPDYRKALEDVKRDASAEDIAFIDANAAILSSAHARYDEAASTGTLNDLTSSYNYPGKQKDHSTHDFWRAYNLYNSSLAFVAEHWKNLISLNGNKTLICPICGLEPCTDMDHYAPRSKFPEQSCHIGNLIPTCNKCNKRKFTRWIDNNGRQMIFNAFHDTRIPESILDYSLRVSPKGDLMDVEVNISDSLDYEDPQHFRIITTIQKLKLLDNFQEKASNLFKIRITDLRIRYKNSHSLFRNVDHFIESQKIVMEESITNRNYQDFIDKDLMVCIARNNAFHDYIKSILIKMNS